MCSRFIAKQEGNWAELDVATVAILEIFLPNETIAIRKLIVDDSNPPSSQDVAGYQTFVLEPSVESLTKLLSITVDHIDTLLEDWYPVLGKSPHPSNRSHKGHIKPKRKSLCVNKLFNY